MILNKGNYQISQMTGSEKVTIYRRDECKPYKVIPAAKDLTAFDLEKILDLYVTEANNDG